MLTFTVKLCCAVIPLGLMLICKPAFAQTSVLVVDALCLAVR